MHTLTIALALIVCLIHVYIVVLEMLWWDTPKGHKAFGLKPDFAKATKVLAANQGLYNGFLAAGLFYAAITGSREFAVFFLACVLVAGAYGAWSVNKRIFFVQALPAIAALVALHV